MVVIAVNVVWPNSAQRRAEMSLPSALLPSAMLPAPSGKPDEPAGSGAGSGASAPKFARISRAGSAGEAGRAQATPGSADRPRHSSDSMRRGAGLAKRAGMDDMGQTCVLGGAGWRTICGQSGRPLRHAPAGRGNGQGDWRRPKRARPGRCFLRSGWCGAGAGRPAGARCAYPDRACGTG